MENLDFTDADDFNEPIHPEFADFVRQPQRMGRKRGNFNFME